MHQSASSRFAAMSASIMFAPIGNGPLSLSYNVPNSASLAEIYAGSFEVYLGLQNNNKVPRIRPENVAARKFSAMFAERLTPRTCTVGHGQDMSKAGQVSQDSDKPFLPVAKEIRVDLDGPSSRLFGKISHLRMAQHLRRFGH